ncbi:allophanate hydrolase [Amylibacter marinus]|uniref:Allophanate hydrolase n=1 Tax=Amylibacter marinus TaxID=1475483 RepID=A0ABQ5VU82_9RHOB|nr:biotin-dependent carboxyltransferase family protein [Amylibacter marinus]GLQ34699.1 allophanate hydrolase [Amylibacter marinus]
MREINVLKTGPANSIQDLGRFGHQRLGITQSGPMDLVAFRTAQILLDNPDNAPMIELAGMGGDFRLGRNSSPVQFALTGAKFAASLNSTAIDLNRVYMLGIGDVLSIGAAQIGNYGYLALRGGIDIEHVLGSSATHSRAGLGGHQGRTLRAGDQLSVGSAPKLAPVLIPSASRSTAGIETIHVIQNPQSEMFTPASLDRFYTQVYSVTAKMDRMGVYLTGHPLSHRAGHDIISDGNPNGAIQIPGSGLPIVLLADRQPTGGYPKIATIITADLGRFAQLRGGQKLRFQPVSHAQALEKLRRVNTALENTPKLLVSAPDRKESRLLSYNLISGAISSGDTMPWED